MATGLHLSRFGLGSEADFSRFSKYQFTYQSGLVGDDSREKQQLQVFCIGVVIGNLRGPQDAESLLFMPIICKFIPLQFFLQHFVQEPYCYFDSTTTLVF